MRFISQLAIVVLALAVLCSAQKTRTKLPAGDNPTAPAATGTNAAAEDISGMYSFLREGEFLQINLDKDGVSGYISRMGTLPSDRDEFLDHFFTKAEIRGHDVSFTTRHVHSIWYEFKGRYDRGPAKTKIQDGYYVIRGTLTEFTIDTQKNTTSRSREVEFKLLGQPEEDDVK
jgi:hypothetical protein